MAQSNSEEDINTLALLHLPPQINSLLSRPPLPLFLFCVCVFRYLSQFGMKALQLHTDHKRWREMLMERGRKAGRDKKREQLEGCWHLTGLFFFLYPPFDPHVPTPHCLSLHLYVCLYTYVYVCRRNCHHTFTIITIKFSHS